jgi:probable addiction module antidote protein
MRKKSAPRDATYADYLIESLRNPAEAAAYLEAAMEEDDPATFLLALRQVAQARGMTAVARKAKLGRESLYKTLSGTGNPELRTVNQLLHAMGLKLVVQAA